MNKDKNTSDTIITHQPISFDIKYRKGPVIGESFDDWNKRVIKGDATKPTHSSPAVEENVFPGSIPQEQPTYLRTTVESDIKTNAEKRKEREHTFPDSSSTYNFKPTNYAEIEIPPSITGNNFDLIDPFDHVPLNDTTPNYAEIFPEDVKEEIDKTIYEKEEINKLYYKSLADTIKASAPSKKNSDGLLSQIKSETYYSSYGISKSDDALNDALNSISESNKHLYKQIHEKTGNYVFDDLGSYGKEEYNKFYPYDNSTTGSPMDSFVRSNDIPSKKGEFTYRDIPSDYLYEIGNVFNKNTHPKELSLLDSIDMMKKRLFDLEKLIKEEEPTHYKKDSSDDHLAHMGAELMILFKNLNK